MSELGPDPQSPERKQPFVEGPTAVAYQAFARLVSAEGAPEPESLEAKRDLWLSEVTPEGENVYHLYFYAKPSTSIVDNDLYLATLDKARRGSTRFDLSYEIRATMDGGVVKKYTRGEAEVPNISDEEKTELAARLEEFQDKLVKQDPGFQKLDEPGWD